MFTKIIAISLLLMTSGFSAERTLDPENDPYLIKQKAVLNVLEIKYMGADYVDELLGDRKDKVVPAYRWRLIQAHDAYVIAYMQSITPMLDEVIARMDRLNFDMYADNLNLTPALKQEMHKNEKSIHLNTLILVGAAPRQSALKYATIRLKLDMEAGRI